ncbi:MAG: hypothetical protein ACD_39C01969G0001 [uncultured bacterium]|nr:MAG: hypothetical protein ACD_39C01969G0001 [uncultured bacterium]
MEFVMLVCSTTLQEDLERLFRRHQIAAFTQMPTVYGSGNGGGTRLDTETWPGLNMMYILALPQEKYVIVRDWVASYRTRQPREGVKLFSLALKEML